MIKYVFIIAFVVSVILQGFSLYELDMADTSMWAHEAEYIQDSNPAQFNLLGAYGHPGGPIIEGTIFIHNAFNISYEKAILVFLTVFDGLIIAGVCALCFILSKNHFWWPVALISLSLNDLYQSSTPTSTIASLLVVFLCLLTLFLYKKEESIKLSLLALWSLIAGLLISTRVDIGVVITFALIILLKQKISWKQISFIFLAIVSAFVIFDPFMWFIPVKHIKDLIFKITYHYNDFTPTRMSPTYLLSFSALTFVSIFVSWVVVFFKERSNNMLPVFFLKILTITTLFLYVVFLTAKSQASRYFLPLILIWEVLLSASIFDLVEGYDLKKKNFIKIFVISILSFYYVGLFVYALWINKNYNLLP